MISGDVVPPVLRQISVRAVMDELLHKGAASRADLAKATGLSKQTMSEVIRALEEGGWVRIKGMTSGHVGRAAVTYEVATDMGYVIGVDLGATTTRIAVANIVGSIVARREAASDARGGQHLVAQLQSLKADLLAESGVPTERILLAAVATPGVVDPVSGTLSLAPNISDIGGFDLAAALARSMDCDVVIENDVNAAVIGESWLGCAVGFDEVAYVSLGTGIGLGALVNGRLLRGATGAAGEIGFLPFGSDPKAETSLEKGALECVIGARGIRARYRDAGGDAEASVRDILDSAAAGDARAATVAAETGRIAAQLVVAVNALLDPKKIVLGGNIGRHRLIVDAVRAELPTISRRAIAVEASALRSDATLTGAVAIALNQAHNFLFSPQALPQPIKLPPPPR